MQSNLFKKNKYFINEHNLLGEVLVNITQHEDCKLIRAFKRNKVIFSNAYIINDKVQLQIKYCSTPQSKDYENQDWIVYHYKFKGSEALKYFSSKRKTYIGLLALNKNDNSAHRIFYYELSLLKYSSKQYDTIDLYTKKHESPFVKVYSKNDLFGKIETPWSKFPEILFKKSTPPN